MRSPDAAAALLLAAALAGCALAVGDGSYACVSVDHRAGVALAASAPAAGAARCEAPPAEK